MSEARCLVFTEKEGLLSKLAHDLRLRVGSFDVKIEGAGETRRVVATFDATSLVVETALSGGVDNPGALTIGDRKKIDETIQKDILNTRKHREICFRSTNVTEVSDGFSVVGELALNGRTRTMTLRARDVGDAWETRVTLHQPDYGIKPYRAALGALKIKPDVRVELHIPKP